MIKIYITTSRQKKLNIPIPHFILKPIINFTFSDFLWKFIKTQTKDKTVNEIYSQIPLIKELLKICSEEIRTDNWLDPLLECSLKDGTYVKIEIY